MDKIKDLLEKAIFHKYIRKEPDGKGGFRYVYEEKEIESRSKIINKKQDVIEMTNVNPKQTVKSFKKWLEDEGIKYEHIESKSTASSYFKFKKKNSDFDIRISNHTKKNQDKETDLGIDFNLYGDGSSDISINTAYGYKTEDLKKIISDVERLSSKKNYETIIKESNDFELLDLPKREGVLRVLEKTGIEESEYALLYSFVEKWMDFNRTKSEYKSYLENKRQEKAQKNEEVQKQSFTIGDVTVYPQKDKKSFDWEYIYNKEKPQGTAEEVKKWKEDRKEAMKYAKLNSWKIYNQTIAKSMEIIEKAKKGSPIGTEKTWGGKVYVKTDKGWKPKGKGTKKVDEEGSTSKHSSTEILTKQAVSATDEQLKAAINDPEANSELKKVAQEELNKRNKQQNSDDKSSKQFTVEDAYKNLLEAQEKGELELSQDVLDEIQKKLQESKEKKENKEETVDNKLDKLKQEITSEIDKKLSDMTGFKKITQTYVKKDGKTVVIKMKGDNQYKATSPGFKLESKPYESLTDFKKRIKEELDKQSTKTEKEELSFAEGKEFESNKQFYKWNEERSQLPNLYNEEDVKRMESEANEYLSKGNLNSSLKSYIYGEIDNFKFEKVLEKYGSCNDEEKKAVNAILIAQGYAPIANGLDYHNYKGEDYLYINPRNSSDDDREYMKIYKEDANEITSKWTDDQRKAIRSYTSSGFLAIRDILTESPEIKNWPEERIERTKNRINHIKEFIEQNPLKRNMVLNRRLQISEQGNNLSTWLNAKVGQVIEDKSFASFGMRHEDYFGSDLQITLLAKKGDSVINVDNAAESEYLVQAGSKYKVLARGTNSIVVEII